MCSSPKTNHRTVSRSGNSSLHLSSEQYASYAKVANAALERREQLKAEKNARAQKQPQSTPVKKPQTSWLLQVLTFDLKMLFRSPRSDN
ncbi:hypothetical protein [Neptuniibacter pectenicola]|jgi:hypothetical protein|uniref:hypothetical protein n=1 Tax=Neptuniibacter pectenicola TaxID=1806669 RepID=UPI0030ED3B82